LENRRVVSTSPISGSSDNSQEQDVFIGRSEAAMWMRIVSSWICFAIYTWSLIAPLVLPDRFGDE